MGLCIATMCAAEAPLFHFAAPIFNTLGLQLVLNMVMFVYILRLCLYGFLPLAGTPWAVLPIEALHGVTFGCAWAAGTLYSSRIAPPGLEATTQALFNVRSPLFKQDHASSAAAYFFLAASGQALTYALPGVQLHGSLWDLQLRRLFDGCAGCRPC